MICTFYGQWLPGDRRGSGTSVRDRRDKDPAIPVRFEHSDIDEEYEPELPDLFRAALDQLQGPQVVMELAHAEALLSQFQETALHRGWDLLERSEEKTAEVSSHSIEA
jgi:hypothetical protein